ncbi:ABC transporter permease [Fictibacillus iocasae]|uniref:ABC transporter permease n=1 Tax=Fictibacillus iocasae TaxID=2715437 RepID=A0ABW2NQT7_9BACL
MSKFLVVLFHTYKTKIKSKPFILSTAITIALLFVIANMDQIVKVFSGDGPDKIGVIDESGEFLPLLKEQAKPLKEDLQVVEIEDEESAKKSVASGKLEGYLIIKKSGEGLPEGTFKADDVTKQSQVDDLQNALQQVKNVVSVQSLGLTKNDVERLYSPVGFEKVSLLESAKSEEEASQAYILVYILLFFMYMAVMMYGTMIATEVATEKSSRVMEILISSVSPVKQMFGKIFGIVLVAFTQLIIFGFASYSALQLNQELSGKDSLLTFLDFNSIPASLFSFAVLYFLLGFFMYATLFAMLGSLISRVEEVNSLLTPLIMVIVGAFLIAMYGRENPESALVTGASYFPLFTPMIMLLRVGMTEMPVWEIMLSIAILMAAIASFAVIGARVYRGGVLMYGGSPSLKLVKQALIMSKEEKNVNR